MVYLEARDIVNDLCSLGLGLDGSGDEPAGEDLTQDKYWYLVFYRKVQDRTRDTVQGTKTPAELVERLATLPTNDAQSIIRELFSSAEANTAARNLALLQFYEALDKKFGQKYLQRVYRNQSIETAFPAVSSAIAKGQETRTRIDTAKTTVRNYWGTRYIDHPFFRHVFQSENLSREFSAFVKKNPNTAEAFTVIGKSMLYRLGTPHKGRSSITMLVPADLKVKADLIVDVNGRDPKWKAVMDRFQMNIDSDGLPRFGPGTWRIEPALEPPVPGPSAGPAWHGRSASEEADLPSIEDTPAPASSPYLEHTHGQTLAKQKQQQPGPYPSSSRPASGDYAPAISSPLASAAQLHPAFRPASGEFTEPPNATSRPGSSLHQPRPSATPGATLFDDQVLALGCKCTQEVPQDLIHALNIRPVHFDLSSQQKVINQLRKLEKDVRDSLCGPHWRIVINGVLGLNQRKMTRLNLEKRLWIIANRIMAPNRYGTLEQLQIKNASWFLRTRRPYVASDLLGPYRFKPEEAVPTTFTFAQFNLNNPLIQQRLGLVGRLGEDWSRTGTIVVPDVFKWWSQGQILNIGKVEFDMYRWHQRRINNANNISWCRTVFHSILQQLMRQDPVYWMIYALLRPDRQHRLVSYPYYAKYQHPAEGRNEENLGKEGFRHLDYNITRMAEEKRGANQIQGTLSITSELAEDCTVMLDGMHKKFFIWYERLKLGGLLKSGYVEKIEAQHAPPSFLIANDLQWNPRPVQSLGVRISMPTVPHGALPAKGYRQTLFPWFVAYDEDSGKLEVEESGTWDNLSAAHRDLLPGPCTPSGHAIKYGVIPYRFPAAVSITGLGAVSDALVARQKWSSPEVNYMVQVWGRALISDNNRWETLLSEWRINAETAARKAIGLVELLEKDAFGKRSFFNNNPNVAKDGKVDWSKQPQPEGDEEHDDDENGVDSNQ